MSGSLLLWMTLALATFWAVGVYNRLMRMRARGLEALGSVEKHMKQCADLVQVHVPSPHQNGVAAGIPEPAALADEWAALFPMLQALERAFVDARAVPLAPPALRHIGQAFDELQRGWASVCASPEDLAGEAVPAPMQCQWDAQTVKVRAARAGFNKITHAYNAALFQFPARLVVGTMGFKMAGEL